MVLSAPEHPAHGSRQEDTQKAAHRTWAPRDPEALGTPTIAIVDVPRLRHPGCRSKRTIFCAVWQPHGLVVEGGEIADHAARVVVEPGERGR